MKRALLLSSSVKSQSDHLPYSRESSVHSDSRLSAYSLPGPGHPYSRYSSPSLGLQTGNSWIGRPEPALQPHPADVS